MEEESEPAGVEGVSKQGLLDLIEQLTEEDKALDAKILEATTRDELEHIMALRGDITGRRSEAVIELGRRTPDPPEPPS